MGNSLFTTPEEILWQSFEDETSDRAFGLIQGLLNQPDSKEENIMNIYFHGKNLLHRSIECNKFDLFKFLIEKGANITTGPQESQKNSLMFFRFSLYNVIAQYGRIQFLEYVILQPWYRNGFLSQNLTLNSPETPLYYAVKYNQVAMIERILALSPAEDINNAAQILVKFCPIHVAAQFSSLETFEFLISKGADLKKTTLTGATCLMIAIQSKNIPVINFLIPHKDNLAELSRLDGFNAVHMAVEKELPQTLLDLLNLQKINVNASEKKGCTPLMLAASKKSRILIEILLNAGADKSIKYADGKTALDMARLNNANQSIIDLLQ